VIHTLLRAVAGKRISGVHGEFTPAVPLPEKPALSCVYVWCAILALDIALDLTGSH